MAVSTFLLTFLGVTSGGLVTLMTFIGVYLWQEIPHTPQFNILDHNTWYPFATEQSVWQISVALYALFACVGALALMLTEMAVILRSVGVRNKQEKYAQYEFAIREIEDKQKLILAQIKQLNAAEMRDETAAAKDNAIACAYQQLEIALAKANSVDEINEALKTTVQLLNFLAHDSNANSVNTDMR